MDIQDLLDDDISIASLPRVYHQFQEAMCDKNTSFTEIGEIIIHDIGQIVLCKKLPELTLKILLDNQTQPKQLHIAEFEELGFDHAELGGRLLEKWNLSEFHVEITTFHHDPNRAPNYSLGASILYFADILANIMKLGSSGESTVPPVIDEEVRERIQLPEQIRLTDLKEKIYKAYDETVGLFLQVA